MSMSTDNQSFFSIEETFKCLEITFCKGSKSEEINEAQNKLMELDNNILYNYGLILEGIRQKDKYKDDLKLSALIYLKNSIEGKIKRKILGEDQIWIIIKTFIDFLISSSGLSDKIVNNVNNLLKNIFDNGKISKNNPNIIDLFNMLGSFIKNHINKNLNDDLSFDIGIFKRIILLIQMIIPTKSFNENNNNQIFENSLHIVDLIIIKTQNISQNIINKFSNNVIIP